MITKEELSKMAEKARYDKRLLKMLAEVITTDATEDEKVGPLYIFAQALLDSYKREEELRRLLGNTSRQLRELWHEKDSLEISLKIQTLRAEKAEALLQGKESDA